MRLQKPFCRLPVRFDAARLRAEVEAAPASAWHDHPDGYAGNSALRLITVGGTENDGVSGEMKPTPHLRQFPYLQQTLASFGVVWSRARLMRLGPRGTVPPHRDVKYHWHYRVRVHVPIVTNPNVRFTCAGETVHMAAGDAWIFDNWLPHSVENGSDEPRIHLVADTMGNERFWRLVSRGQWSGFDAPAPVPLVEYRSESTPALLTERFNTWTVMPPAELEALVDTLCADLSLDGHANDARTAVLQFVMTLKGFCSEWRQLWSLFADRAEGWRHYVALRTHLRDHVQRFDVPARLRSNDAAFVDALRDVVLVQTLNLPAVTDVTSRAATTPIPAIRVERPVFIVAAPRSGSSLLFETLAQCPSLYTFGGEAHHLVEQFPALRPGYGTDSNRLTAADLTPEIARAIQDTIARDVRDRDGRTPESNQALRLLEKTPKNALRLPFFRALFPDARFVFLWREPRDNLSSIMEAWRSGRFITYPSLDDANGPWSLLLPPGWRDLRGRPLEEIAAFQWRVTNELLLDDLAQLPARHWTAVRYEDFLANPAAEIQRLCRFMDVPYDDRVRDRVAAPLPASRHTLTAPAPEKWRKNEPEILRVLATVEPLAARLRAMTAADLAATA